MRRLENKKIFSSLLILVLSLNCWGYVGAIAAENIDDWWGQLSQAEAQKNWDQALSIAAQYKGDDPDLTGHIDQLRNTITVLESAKNYEAAGLSDYGIEIIEEYLKGGNKLRDSYLVIALNQELQRLSEPFSDGITYQAINAIKRMRNLNNEKEYDEALIVADNVLTSPKVKYLDPQTALTLNILKKQSEQGKQAKTETLWGIELFKTLKEQLGAWTSFLISLAIILLIYFVLKYRKNKAPARPGTALDLTDNTVEDKEQQESANRLFSQEFAYILQRLVGGKSELISSGALMDLDATNLPSTSNPMRNMEVLASHIDASPVSIGPFKFQPKQLMQYFAILFRRPFEYTLNGDLSEENGYLTLHLEKRTHDGSLIEGGYYESTRHGVDKESRREVIEDVAAQIVVSLAQHLDGNEVRNQKQESVTDNWKSLKAYMEAQKKLSHEDVVEDRKELLTEVKSDLQTAIQLDPANWMARYELANVLRKRGENNAAKEQYNYLGRMILSDAIWDTRALAKFIQSRTDFPWLVRYNHTAALSKQGDQKSVTKSLRNFNRMLESLTDKHAGLVEGIDDINNCKRYLSEELDAVTETDAEIEERWEDIENRLKDKKAFIGEEEARRMVILIIGARTAVLATLLAFKRESFYSINMKSGERDSLIKATREAMDGVLDCIIRDEEWLWERTKKVKTGNWPTYAISHATAQNARGKAWSLMDHRSPEGWDSKDKEKHAWWEHSKRFLEYATQIHVPSNFPEPYVNLAGLYLRKRQEICPDWQDKAEHYLNTALALSPKNQRAHYLLARVHQSHRPPDYEKVLKSYENAGTCAWALNQRARIQLNIYDKPDQALSLLQKSIACSPERIDSRYAHCVRIVIELIKRQSATMEQLLYAKKAIKKLHDSAATKLLYDQSKGLKSKLNQAVKDQQTNGTSGIRGFINKTLGHED